MPFTVLGDPDPETSLTVLRAFAEGGADMLELGIAFSDPIADGPVIQAADLRAFRSGVTPAGAFELLRAFRREHDEIPIGLLVYANLVWKPGPANFFSRAAEAGVDSILVADLPVEEAAPFLSAARSAGIGAVFMVTPLTDEDRLALTLRHEGPYLYIVTRAGVTGKDKSLARGAFPLIARIRRRSEIPTLLGFGISRPEHVREALSAGADGAISGSAVVEIIADHCDHGEKIRSRAGRERLSADLRGFVAAMKKATLK